MTNREKYLALLKANGITQAKSAELIAAVTQRPCSPRTVRSWLNDPDKPSSTPCPDWAVAALEKAIEYMVRALQRRDAARAEAEAAGEQY
ncbi:hypothetical protein Q1Z72_01420 [Pseudomonas qingdaonensis]|uniref:hypothetical protein n=1 Tax=Pseudomonas TaxID=286 RepID=UPI0021185F62|nr:MULTISPECIES: hypothetical protein [Pseudomonas]UXH55942.1 hypothetical protein N5876_32870 [Pseudomonas aeruginosa]UXH68986.1 hypothetical protein N5879_32310 [Pseudomonas aeruginosa]WKL67354.1 hypothetical protein Q1Z72_01420 [Pseudomonas qingdaonensis]